MQKIVGYILILLGVAFLILNVLVWFGVLTPAAGLTIGHATGWDVLLALVQKLPWLSIVGLMLIYGGMKMVGVALPF